MSDRTSIALLPSNMSETDWARAGEVVSPFLSEDPLAIRRRVATTGFIVERMPSVQAVHVMNALIEAKLAAVALPAQKVLPQPRRLVCESVFCDNEVLNFGCRNMTYQFAVRDLLHIHFCRLRVEGRRRRLTRGGREVRVEKDVILVDLFFKGGGAFRIELFKVSFDDDAVLRELPRGEAMASFLDMLATWCRNIRRPILPTTKPFSEGLNHPSWRCAELRDGQTFDMRGRWWFALAANGQLPSQHVLNETAEALLAKAAQRQRADRRTTNFGPGPRPSGTTPSTRRTVSMPKLRSTAQFQAPQIGPSYEEVMREAADLESRGRLDLAAKKYQTAITLRDSFEARLSLIEALVDSNPFEAWRLCREAAENFPTESEQLVDEYRGVHRENYDCHEFLTYRGLRRFLRAIRMPPVNPDDALKKFFQAHDLSNKLPDATKGGLLTAYGEQLNFRFPPKHKALIGAYNGLDLFNRAFRFLGVGSDDEAFDIYMFNKNASWRRFYGNTVTGLVAFGFDYLGNIFFYDPRQNIDDPAIVRLDADSGELEPVADNFTEFLIVDMTDKEEDVVRPRLLREWQNRNGPLAMRECLSFQTSPVLGGTRSVDNLTTSELGIRLHMAGQIASQARQIPEGARINGVRIVNQEELLLKVFWEL